MLNSLLDIDHYLTILIGGMWHQPFLDWLAPIWRNMSTWFPLYIFLILIILLRFKSKGFVLILFVISCVGISDLCSNYIFKKNVKRLRPCRTQIVESQIKPLVNCGSGYSFTSSHAANHTALAASFSFLLPYRKRLWKIVFYAWAFSIGLAQVYVGLHFVSDVIAGCLLGYGISSLVFFLWKRTSVILKYVNCDFY